jgi:hypothetical protein
MGTNGVADLVDSLVLGCCGRCVLLRPWRTSAREIRFSYSDAVPCRLRLGGSLG